jgi:hypothetical protein
MAKKVTIKKPKKVINQEEPEYSFLLTGDKALLLAEGCKLNKQKKEIDKRLTEIKKSLEFEKAGDYSNSAGDVVNFSLVPKFSEPDPKEFHSVMKSKKLTKFFWGCVKVGITEAKKFLTEKELDKLRTELDPTKKYTFK